MRTDIPPEILAALNKREGLKVRLLYWIRAKNRSTGAEESLGIWNGEDTRQFVINGQTRPYVGGGGFLNADPLKQAVGLNIQRWTMMGSPVSPEFQNAVRLYDPKGAPVELHVAFFDTETDQLLADPYRVFRGWINTLNIQTGQKNGESTIKIDHVGNARILTRLLPAKRSNESQRRRNAADSFFSAVTISGSIQTPWGSKSIQSAGPDNLFQRVANSMINKG